VGNIHLLDTFLVHLFHQVTCFQQVTSLNHNGCIGEFLPDYGNVKLPAVIKKDDEKSFSSERELLYKILFDMKSDMNDLKKLVFDLIGRGDIDVNMHESNNRVINNLFRDSNVRDDNTNDSDGQASTYSPHTGRNDIQDTEEIIEELNEVLVA